MSEIKIAFFDVDGTLASNTIHSEDNYERVPESAKKALKLLKENGITPVIATGRGRLFINPLVEKLGMDSFIASNGLSVTYQLEEIYHHYLTKNEVNELITKLNLVDDIEIIFETARGNLSYKKNEPLTKIDDIYQFIVIGKDLKEKINIVTDTIKASMVAPMAMNIYPKHLSKATGIKRMLELLHFSVEEAICFGDEENDLEMFKAVKYTVAMGNSVEALKKIASYVTTSVDEDGIYNACIHFGLF